MYDCIIVGGGISGLYVAYHLIQKGLRILILEKEDQCGGRIYTFHGKKMTVDAGAGRFSSQHHLFITLLKEFGLFHKKRVNGTSVAHCYINSTGGRHWMNSALDYDNMVLRQKYDNDSAINLPINIVNGVINETMDIMLTSISGSTLANTGLISRVLAVGAITPKSQLIKKTFIEFAGTILTKDEIQFLLGSFGYYSELVLMNAYDCMKLILDLNPNTQTFYSLEGGLTQLIELMTHYIVSHGGKILTKKAVKGIRENKNGFTIYGIGSRGGDFSFQSKKVVCALTKESLMQFPIFRTLTKELQHLVSAPLCRIYAKYPVTKNKTQKVWFQNLPRLTVNNELRMVIPISEDDGIIMISYTDNKYAEFWKKIWDNEKSVGLNSHIQKLIYNALGIQIPDAEDIHIFYWHHGVGYWGVNMDSSKISRKIVQPFSTMKLYICGENFSDNYQQWIEGALETGKRVVDIL